MKKKGFLRIKGETFPYDVIVCLGTTREEILAYMEKKYLNALTEKDKEALVMKGNGRVLHLENNAFICWTKDFPKKAVQFSHLAHEIFHTADLILRRAGLELSDDSDEAFAYQIGWLTKKIYEEFKLAPL